MPDVTNQRVQKRDPEAVQRVSKAIKLRASKVKYDDIAKQCGYGSAAAAHKAVMRELQRVIIEDVEELRREEVDSLEQLELECWKRLMDKEHDRAKLFAVDRILAIKERRAKLLGLDIPVKQQIDVYAQIVALAETAKAELVASLADETQAQTHQG